MTAAMPYRRSPLYRFRGLIILALLACSIFFLTARHYVPSDETTRAASIIAWMKDGGYEILLPTAEHSAQGRGRGRRRASQKAGDAKPGAVPTSRPGTPPPAHTDFAPQNEKILQLQQELRQQHTLMDPLTKEFMSWREPAVYQPKKKPGRKPDKSEPTAGKPVPDPFPLLSRPLEEVRKKLVVPAVNRPPKVHVSEQTPLLIGFTRNWPQLLQCVSSYIAAGWPPEDIYIVENTGVMNSNRDNKLTLQNPFYLNHTQLHMLGVNVVIAPTLLSFAQLQNYYSWIALENDWDDFFWSHQDVVAFSFEKEFRSHLDGSSRAHANYSLYARAVAILRYLRQPGIPKWANHFFAYDHLTLVHRDAVLDVGGWDTHIPFYSTDCDFYLRQRWAGYFQGSTQIGIIIDTSTVLDDFGALFRVPGIQATFQGDPGPDQLREAQDDDRRLTELTAADRARQARVDKEGETIEQLVDVAYRMQAVKYIDGGWWRNMWQLRQGGGQGEPFYRDQEGFQVGLDTMIETGRRVFADKWGHRGCDIFDRTTEDAWKLQRDWNPATEGQGFEGAYW